MNTKATRSPATPAPAPVIGNVLASPSSLRILQELEALRFGHSLGGEFRVNRRLN